MRMTSPLTRTEPPEWLSDPDSSIIIGEGWRKQQQEVYALPSWFIEPTARVKQLVRQIAEADKPWQLELDEPDAEQLHAHLKEDPILWLHAFAWYQRRDPPRRWQRGKLTAGQLVVAWSFALRWKRGLPVRDVLLKARRQGFSLVVSALMAWIHFFHENRGGLQAANERDIAEVLHRYAKKMLERMPRAIRPAARYSTKGSIVLEEKDQKKRDKGEFGLESYIKTGGAGSDFMGSGDDVQVAHLDEIGKWDKICDVEIQFDSLTNTIPEVGGETWIVLTSTAHGAETFFHKFWKSAIRPGQRGWNGFRAIFIPWFFDERNSMRCPRHEETGDLLVEWGTEDDHEFGNEKALMERFDLDPDQMWWRRTFIQKQTARGGDDSTRIAIFKQEYPATPEEAWLYALGRFLSPKLIDSIYQRAKNLGDPVWRGWIMHRRTEGTERAFAEFSKKDRDGPFRMWRAPEPNQQYLISADVSTGEAADASCLKIHKWTPMKLWLAAEWFGMVTPADLAHIMWRLGWYYNKAYLNWERTGPGMSIAAHLVKGPPGQPMAGYPLHRLYRRKDPNQTRFKVTSLYGVDTSGKSKRGMLDLWVDYAVNDRIELTLEDIAEASQLFVDDRGLIDTGGADRFMSSVVQVQSAFVYQPDWAPSQQGPQQQARPGTAAWLDELEQRARAERYNNYGTTEETL